MYWALALIFFFPSQNTFCKSSLWEDLGGLRLSLSQPGLSRIQVGSSRNGFISCLFFRYRVKASKVNYQVIILTEQELLGELDEALRPSELILGKFGEGLGPLEVILRKLKEDLKPSEVVLREFDESLGAPEVMPGGAEVILFFFKTIKMSK